MRFKQMREAVTRFNVRGCSGMSVSTATEYTYAVETGTFSGPSVTVAMVKDKETAQLISRALNLVLAVEYVAGAVSDFNASQQEEGT